MKSEQIKEITKKATEHLVAALNAGRSEALTSYLKAIGRFHHYSLHNVMLIASQKPNASSVAGFRTWNQLGRFVKKGEKGIVILAPIVRRKAENEEDQQEDSTSVAGFRAAYVFDVSQTDGQELPHIGIVQGQPREYHERLRAFAGRGNFRRILFGDRARAWNIERRDHAASWPVGGGGVLNACARTGPRTPAPGRSPRRHIASNPRNRSGSNGVCRLSRYRAGNRFGRFRLHPVVERRCPTPYREPRPRPAGGVANAHHAHGWGSDAHAAVARRRAPSHRQFLGEG